MWLSAPLMQGNLENLSKLLMHLFKQKGLEKVELAAELMELVGKDRIIYESNEKKREILKAYCNSCKKLYLRYEGMDFL